MKLELRLAKNTILSLKMDYDEALNKPAIRYYIYYRITAYGTYLSAYWCSKNIDNNAKGQEFAVDVFKIAHKFEHSLGTTNFIKACEVAHRESLKPNSKIRTAILNKVEVVDTTLIADVTFIEAEATPEYDMTEQILGLFELVE